MFRSAVANGRLPRTPCVGVKLPKAPDVECEVLTVEQVQRLATAVPPRYRAAVIVQATLGLRGGGVARPTRAGRRPRGAGAARPSPAVAGRPNGFVAEGPKTRTVPPPRHVGVALAAHVLAHAGTDGLLFTSAHGNPLWYDVYAEKVFRPAVERAGLPAGTGTHALRHAAGPHMLAERVPVTTIAKVLGHSVKVLLETYAHALPNADDLAREAMESAWAVSRSVSRTATEER